MMHTCTCAHTQRVKLNKMLVQFLSGSLENPNTTILINEKQYMAGLTVCLLLSDSSRKSLNILAPITFSFSFHCNLYLGVMRPIIITITHTLISWTFLLEIDNYEGGKKQWL